MQGTEWDESWKRRLLDMSLAFESVSIIAENTDVAPVVQSYQIMDVAG